MAVGAERAAAAGSRAIMGELCVVVSMSSSGTRVLATRQDAQERETILKARLSPSPSHPRALQWLRESLSVWQGVPVRAVLAAGKPRSGCGTSLHAEWFADFGNALYSLALDPGGRARRPRHRDCVGALGDFSPPRNCCSTSRRRTPHVRSTAGSSTTPASAS